MKISEPDNLKETNIVISLTDNEVRYLITNVFNKLSKDKRNKDSREIIIDALEIVLNKYIKGLKA